MVLEFKSYLKKVFQLKVKNIWNLTVAFRYVIGMGKVCQDFLIVNRVKIVIVRFIDLQKFLIFWEEWSDLSKTTAYSFKIVSI